MLYTAAKHLHLTAVGLSILLFVVRFLWSQFDRSVLDKKWAKVLPHIIDTILLLSAAWLCVLISQYPFQADWVTFKVIGVVAYILMGMVALKWSRTVAMRWVGFIGALAWIAVIGKVAVTKQALMF